MSLVALSADDLDRIRRAVEELESESSVEVVAAILPASDSYPEAVPRGALLGGWLGLAAIWGWSYLSRSWAPLPLDLLVGLLSGTALGVLASKLPWFRRQLISDRRLHEAVDRATRETFLAREVFKTEQRTGLVVLVSVFEHRLELLADVGLHRVLPVEDWERLATAGAHAVRQHGGVAGLLETLAACRDRFRAAGLRRSPDDRNELPDHLETGR